MNRIIIQTNDRATDFVSSIGLHCNICQTSAEHLTAQVNASLAEMHNRGVLKKSLFASLCWEDE